MVRNKLSHVGVLVAGAALAGVLAGCGNGSDSAAPAPSTESPTSGSSSAPASSDSSGSSAPDTSDSSAPPKSDGQGQPVDNGLCKADDLQLKLGGGDAAAGTSYRSLIFTNLRDTPCTIQGFPGVSYVTGDSGQQVGPAAFRTGSKGAAIKLGKGESAVTDIGLVNVRNYDAGVCKPEQVRGLRVYPPQETESKFVAMDGLGCAGDKIPGNQLTVKTLRKG